MTAIQNQQELIKVNAQYQFAQWQFDPDTGDLLNGTISQHLEPQVSKLLEFFLRNQERVLSRDELISEVWGNRVVSDDAINRCISILRQTLSPDEKQAYIETVPRKGYVAHFPTTLPVSERLADTHRLILGTAAVALLAILVTGLYLLLPRADPNPSPLMSTLAVLPFANLSSDVEQGYLVEGLSDQLLNTLAQVQGLRVTANSSAFLYRDQDVDATEVAAQLGVEWIVDGSVRREGDRLRVNAQLISANQGYHVWGETFDRPANMIFALEDEIARAVVAQVEGALGLALGEVRGSAMAPPGELAREAFLLGMSYYRRRGLNIGENYIRAREYLEKAVELQPDYPEALAYLSLVTGWKWGHDAFDYAPEARAGELAELALALDPGLPQAHAAWAFHLQYSGDIDGALATFDRALELNPNYADVLAWSGRIYNERLDIDKARDYLARAAELDPFALPTVGAYVKFSVQTGDVDEAWRVTERLQKYRASNLATETERIIYMETGEFDRVIMALHEELGEAIKQNFQPPIVYAGLGDAQTAQLFEMDPFIRMIVGNITGDYSPIFTPLQDGLPQSVQLQQKMFQLYVGIRMGGCERFLLTVEGMRETKPDLYQQFLLNIRYAWGVPQLWMAHCLVQVGRAAEGQAFAENFLAQAREELALGYRRVETYFRAAEATAILQRYDETLELLSAYLERGGRFWDLRGPILVQLRDKPGFQEIQARLDEDYARQLQNLRDWESQGQLPHIAAMRLSVDRQ